MLHVNGIWTKLGGKEGGGEEGEAEVGGAVGGLGLMGQKNEPLGAHKLFHQETLGGGPESWVAPTKIRMQLYPCVDWGTLPQLPAMMLSGEREH